MHRSLFQFQLQLLQQRRRLPYQLHVALSRAVTDWVRQKPHKVTDTNYRSNSSNSNNNNSSCRRRLSGAIRNKKVAASGQWRLGYETIPVATEGDSSYHRKSNGKRSSRTGSRDPVGVLRGRSGSSDSSFTSSRSKGSGSGGECASCAAAVEALPATTEEHLQQRQQQLQYQQKHHLQTEHQLQRSLGCRGQSNEGQLVESLPSLSPQQICQAVFRLTRPSSSSRSAEADAVNAAMLREVASYCTPLLDGWPDRDVAMLGVSLAFHYRQQQQQQQQQQQDVGPVVEFLQRAGLHALQRVAHYDPRDLLRLLPLLAYIPPPEAAVKGAAAAAAASPFAADTVGASIPHMLAAVLLQLAADSQSLRGPAAAAAAFAAASDTSWELPEWAAMSFAYQVRRCWQQQQQEQLQQQQLLQQQKRQHRSTWPSLSDAARIARAFCRFVLSNVPTQACSNSSNSTSNFSGGCNSSSKTCSSGNNNSRRSAFWLDWTQWFLVALLGVLKEHFPPLAARSCLSPRSAAAAVVVPAASAFPTAAVQRELSALATSLARTSPRLPAAHAPVWRVLLPQLLLVSTSSTSSSWSADAGEATAQRLKNIALGCAAVARCSLTAAEKQQLMKQFAPALLQQLHSLHCTSKSIEASSYLSSLSPTTAKVLLSSFAAAAAGSEDAEMQRLLLHLCRYTQMNAEKFGNELLAFAAADAGLLCTVSSSELVRTAAAAAVAASCDVLLYRLEHHQNHQQQRADLPGQAAAALLAVCSRLPTVPVRLVELLQQHVLQCPQQQQQKQSRQQAKQNESSVSQLVACFRALSRFPRRLQGHQWTRVEQQLLQRLQQQQVQQQKKQQLELGLEQAAHLLSAYATATREVPEEMLLLLHLLVTPQVWQHRQQQHQQLLLLQQQQADPFAFGLNSCMHLARILEASVSLSLHLPKTRQQQIKQPPHPLQQQQQQQIQTAGSFVSLLASCLCEAITLQRRMLSLLIKKRQSPSLHSSDEQQQNQQQQEEQMAQQVLQQLQRQQRGLVGITAICAAHLQFPRLLAEAIQLHLLLADAIATNAAATKATNTAATATAAASAGAGAAAYPTYSLAPSEELQLGRFVVSVIAGFYPCAQHQKHTWDLLVYLLGGCKAAAAAAARAALRAAAAGGDVEEQQGAEQGQQLQLQRTQGLQQLWTSEKQHGSRPSLRMQQEVAAALSSSAVQQEVRSCLYTVDLILLPMPLLQLC